MVRDSTFAQRSKDPGEVFGVTGDQDSTLSDRNLDQRVITTTNQIDFRVSRANIVSVVT